MNISPAERKAFHGYIAFAEIAIGAKLLFKISWPQACGTFLLGLGLLMLMHNIVMTFMIINEE